MYLSICRCLSMCVCGRLSICPSMYHVSVCLSVGRRQVDLSVCLSMCTSICLFIYLSMSVCLSRLSTYLHMLLQYYLPVYLPIHPSTLWFLVGNGGMDPYHSPLRSPIVVPKSPFPHSLLRTLHPKPQHPKTLKTLL